MDQLNWKRSAKLNRSVTLNSRHSSVAVPVGVSPGHSAAVGNPAFVTHQWTDPRTGYQSSHQQQQQHNLPAEWDYTQPTVYAAAAAADHFSGTASAFPAGGSYPVTYPVMPGRLMFCSVRF